MTPGGARAVGLLLSMILAPAQAPESKKDIPALTRQSVKAIVLIVASDKAGKETRQGSGVVVSSDGKVVTNFHVIAGADSAVIKFPSGAFYLIEGVLAVDQEKDIAILKAAGKDFSFLSLGDSDQVQIGEEVLAIGSPLALEATVSNGIVSSIRELEQGKLKIIQTTAPISPGSSGGALLNLKGEVIGVTTFQSARGQNLNFAIPTNYIRPLLAAERVSSLGEDLAKMPDRRQPFAAQAPPDILAKSKTICIWVSKGSPVLKTEISNKLVKWNKLVLVASPAEADLVLQITQTGKLNLAGEGNQATALLVHRESGQEIWGVTKGGSWAMSGWSEAWVGRAIADAFMRFYDSSARKPRK